MSWESKPFWKIYTESIRTIGSNLCFYIILVELEQYREDIYEKSPISFLSWRSFLFGSNCLSELLVCLRFGIKWVGSGDGFKGSPGRLSKFNEVDIFATERFFKVAIGNNCSVNHSWSNNAGRQPVAICPIRWLGLISNSIPRIEVNATDGLSRLVWI